MEYKSKLIRGRAVRHQLPHGATAEPRRIPEVRGRRMEFRLDCGRDVYVEECHLSLSTLGYFAGSGDAIRTEVIRRLPTEPLSNFRDVTVSLSNPSPRENCPPTRLWSAWSAASLCAIPTASSPL